MQCERKERCGDKIWLITNDSTNQGYTRPRFKHVDWLVKQRREKKKKGHQSEVKFGHRFSLSHFFHTTWLDSRSNPHVWLVGRDLKRWGLYPIATYAQHGTYPESNRACPRIVLHTWKWRHWCTQKTSACDSGGASDQSCSKEQTDFPFRVLYYFIFSFFHLML